MAAAAQPPADLAALQELERRQLTGDPSITPEIGAQIKAKMAAYRQQGLAKPLVNPAVDAMKVSDFGTLLDTIDKADEHVGMTTAGFGGALMQGIPGSSARDLQSTITSLKANLAFDKLQAMRAASPTGGAIGQVSDTEEKMLSSSVAALDQSQSQDQLKENLANVRKHYTAYINSLGLDVSKDEKGLNIVAPHKAVLPGVTDAGGNDTPGGGKAAPLDPEGVGGIGFTDKAHMEADSLPQGGQDFQRQLTDAINSGQLKSADDVVAFGHASKLNEGRGFEVNKDQAQAYFDYVKKGGKSGADVQTPQFKTFDISADRGKGGVAESGKAFLRGIPNVVGMDDELNAVADTFQGGSLRDNLARERAIRDYDENKHWIARGAGTLAGSLPFAFASAAPGVARAAGVEALRGGEGMVAARAAARQAFARRSAVEGGGLAGAYGVGSSDGNIGDRAVSGLAGAVTGAATAYGLTRAGQAAGGRFPGLGRVLGLGGDEPPPGGGNAVTPPVTPQEAGGIAERLGIHATPATTGGNFAQSTQAGLGNLPGSLGPIRDAVHTENNDLANAASGVANRLGNPGTPQQAGEAIATGADAWRRQTSTEGGAIYQRRTDLMGGDNAPVTMGNAERQIQNFAREYPSSPVLQSLVEHPAIRRLAAGLGDNGELTLGEATDALSHIRGVVRNAERSNTITPGVTRKIRMFEQAIEGDVMNAAQASDAIAGRAAGQGAQDAQREGDAFWSDRARAMGGEFKTPLASARDNINVSGEKVYGQMFGDMATKGGNIERLSAAWRRLPEESRNTFAATAFDQMGRAKPNVQNAAQDAWSFDTFGTNWATASPEAKRLVFGGRGVDREIADIVRYTERLKQLGRSRNFSNTGETMAKSGFVGALASAVVGTTAATGSPVAGAGAGAAVAAVYPALNVAAKAFLGVPAARQWMRSAMAATVRGVTGNSGAEANLQVLVRRLPALAARNPQIAGEVTTLEKALLNAVNDNGSLSAAASDKKQKADAGNQ